MKNYRTEEVPADPLVLDGMTMTVPRDETEYPQEKHIGGSTYGRYYFKYSIRTLGDKNTAIVRIYEGDRLIRSCFNDKGDLGKASQLAITWADYEDRMRSSLPFGG